MSTSVKVVARTDEGVPTPADSLLEGFPGDPTIPLIGGVSSAPPGQITILKVVDLAKRQIPSGSSVHFATSSPPEIKFTLQSSSSSAGSASFQRPTAPVVLPTLSSLPFPTSSSPSASPSPSPSTSPSPSISPSSSTSPSPPTSPSSSTSPSLPSSTSHGSSLPSSSPQLSVSLSSPSPTFDGSSASITFLKTVSNTKTFPSSTFIPPSSPTSAIKSTLHNRNTIIGGVVGGVVGFLIVTALYYVIRRSRRGKKRDLAHITAFEVSPDIGIEPASQSKLKVDSHPSAPNPEVLSANLHFIFDSNTARPVPGVAGQNIDEAMDQSSPDIAMPQRVSPVDQSMFHSNRASPELIQSPPIISHNHNPSNLNPLLRDILNVTQSRNLNQGPLDPGDPNVPQNIHILIINQPSNTNGSMANEDRENRGDHYGRYLPRNMDVDTSSLPPSYE